MVKRRRDRKAAAAAPAAPAEVEPEPAPAGKAEASAATGSAAGGRKRRKKAVPKAAGGKRKGKPVLEEPEDSSDSDDDSEEEEQEEGEESDGEDWDVDFEFFDPCEDDYHSVGDMIKNGTWEFVEPNFAEMADAIVGQGNIGSLIKSESDAGGQGAAREDTVCGMLTTLNLRQFEKQSWPKTLGAALLAKAKKHAADKLPKLKALLEDRVKGQEVGLIFSERFVNLPSRLIPALHKAMRDDIDWSCTTPECPEDERPFYKFSHLLGVTRCFEASAPASKAPQGKKRKTAAEEYVERPGFQGLVFPRPEDEVYARNASFFFTFPVAGGSAESQAIMKGQGIRGQEMRGVFAVTRKQFEQVLLELESLPALMD